MYIPPKEILEKYSKVMVNFALGNTHGIKSNDVVLIQYWPINKPLALEIFKRVLENGANAILKCMDDDFEKIMFTKASNEQLQYWPKKYLKAMVDEIDHRIVLLSEEDPNYLKDVDPKKIIVSNKYKKDYRKWLDEKEDAGNLSWSLCLYGTEGMAKEAGLSIEEYWDQIIKACFLDKQDPISEWKKTYELMETIRTKLNNLQIEKLHVVADKTDLWMSLGEDREFIGGKGANIPSFELFTSPDYRGTNGHIFFDYPLYRYGKILKDIYLEFQDGKIITASASQNESLLKEMISQEGADQIGEYSLTDKRMSKINKFMAETLFDENYGGEYGNTHLAIGKSFHEVYTGDSSNFTEKDWEALGFNSSSEHCDIIATSKRTVEALLKDGTMMTIYKDGLFTI